MKIGSRARAHFGHLAALTVTLTSFLAHGQDVPPEVDPATEPQAPRAPDDSTEDRESQLVPPEGAPAPLPPPRVVQVATATPGVHGTAAASAPASRDSFLASLVPEIHGFASQGFMWSTDNNYLANTSQGTFEFTEIGLNFTTQITDRMRVGMQLFMRDLGPIGDYKPQMDWAYLDYRFFDWFGIRAGRTKIPFGLYNEVNDIDAARVPVLLPQSVYPTTSRDFLLAQTGGEVYGNIALGPAGALEYQAYGGTIFVDTTDADQVENFTVPFVVGGRVMWSTPLDGLRVGGTLQALRFDYDLLLAPEQAAPLQMGGFIPADSNLLGFRLPATLWVASIEYAAHDVLMAAEYSQWSAESVSEVPEDVYPAVSVANERFYVMASFRAASWFSPGLYYSYLTPDMSDRSGADGELHDVAVTTRYDINDHWLVKLEAHYMHGTAGLRAELNDGTPPSQLAPDWGLFLIKTTAYF